MVASTLNVMVVEDEHIVARDIQGTLRDIGYAASCVAASGEGAVEQAEANQPDVVLMDIRLEGEMDGIEAADQITKRFDVPVIFLTAFADDSLVERAKTVRPYGYIMKPYQERELYATIEVAMHRHEREREQHVRLSELEQEADKFSLLRGAISICARCKKIRNNGDGWERIEAYIRNCTGASFTRCLCPDCYDVEMAKIDKWNAEQHPPPDPS